MSSFPQVPSFSFSLLNPSSARFGPRLGTILLKRAEQQTEIQVQTPNFLTTTSRGVIPHLSRDHYGSTAIRWANLPFESFLDVLPPVPTLVPGKNPLHTFLGFSLGQHIVSMSVRDPADRREMPPNGNTHVSAYSLRGVRKVTPTEWKSYVYLCKPDIVFALTDTPFTQPPYSQKRLTKSIERSASWLANIIASSITSTSTSTATDDQESYKPSVLVHMAGATSIPARKAFAENLAEKLFGPEAELIKPLKTLDQGVSGYTFDLVPLRLSLDAAKKHQNPFYPPIETPPALQNSDPTSPPLSNPEDVDLDRSHADQLSPLLRASLESLPIAKVRLVNTVQTPHEILRLISSVGIDIFDAHWAQRAADIGVALDFTFPAPTPSSDYSSTSQLKTRANGKLDIGHNLYDTSYTRDHSPFSSEPCGCRACSPVAPSTRIYHGVDSPQDSHERTQDTPLQTRIKPSFTRAYLHHLLHTHEMSAHSLLALHNLSILETFFTSIRTMLSSGDDKKWDREVQRFMDVYDEKLEVFDDAKVMWRDVDLARGKGRLAREKMKVKQDAPVENVAVV